MVLPGIFCVLVAVAGWYYLFYSTAATRLGAVENPQRNRLRIRLRRAGGMLMLFLSFSFYAGTLAIQREQMARAAVYLLAVFALLGAVIILALIDLRLTRVMRRQQRLKKDDS